MANVLNEEKKQQVLALGRLGWSLRRIQQATRIRRETASAYLKAAGVAVRPPSGWGRRAAKPANEVITDSGAAKPTVTGIPNPDPDPNSNPSSRIRIIQFHNYSGHPHWNRCNSISTDNVDSNRNNR